MTGEPIDITAEEAETALRSGAFTIGEEYEGAGRVIIHTFAGAFGADWDLDAAIDFLKGAQRIAWSPHLLGHDLAVVNFEGRLVRFDVPAPEASR